MNYLNRNQKLRTVNFCNKSRKFCQHRGNFQGHRYPAAQRHCCISAPVRGKRRWS